MKSIASKFNLLTIFLIMLTTLVTGGYLMLQQHANAFRNFARHGVETAMMLSRNIETAVYTENRPALADSIQGLKENPDIAYLVILNKDHKVLLQKKYFGLSKIPALTALKNTLVDGKIISRDTIDPDTNEAYIDIIAPVYRPPSMPGDLTAGVPPLNSLKKKPELIGYIQLGLSQNKIYQDSRQFLLQNLVVGAMTLIIGIILTLWQTRRIIRPLKRLTLATQLISQGDFDKQLNISSNDEIGELATSFNTMSRDLARYQTAMSSYLETLEELVAQRTADLQLKTDEACQLAVKAEAANKAKSQFLATMSHEIRTPMNAVLGMTELLLGTELNNRQQHLAQTVFHSAESLLAIIDNILDFSKIEAGKFRLIIKDFNLRQLLEETAETLSIQAKQKCLELILNLPYDLDGIVRGDADRLRQVLLNLLGNAIKFTEQGEIQLKVSYLQASQSATQLPLLFEIIDTGSGIAADQQQQIFESFTQVDGSITRRFGGTGLGLAISRQLVQLMGGKLEVTSTPGKGSCFHFSLNLEKNPQAAVIPKININALNGLVILVVTDNASQLTLLHDQLSGWKADCHCASSGEQAVKALIDAARLNRPFQYALLDSTMPDMDGLTLAKTIHSDPQIPPLKLALLSSDGIAQDQQRYIDHGICYFLNKPVTQHKLLNCLLDMLESPESTLQSPLNPDIKLQGNILLAEDNFINQEVAMGLLRAIGCQGRVVNNGLEAVQACKNDDFDLILMDCHMPVMDGFEATIQIRQYEQASNKPRRPIVALTADVQKGIVEQCLESGMDSYLSKPFNKQRLQDILKTWLPVKPDQ